ncbi:short-chain dehydrogenase [Steroidobacter denitrificans]|uniref:Short-chain dehydrogenase n=1 Tax=Steroidobacter denitrificans TaxID=465721 RepID=A0A127F567_STEDE|nr:SDR family NAD(P)-dependent oxidoreductase [Steroidobacter denitrificans]AMN45567.1 short-chain dehydrogenase [Steroidobacter denitrificans]
MTTPRDLKEKFKEKYGPWALVTGASSGIGEQFARQLARNGINLLLVARRADRLARLAQELGRRRGLQIEPIIVDLAESEAVDRIVAAIGDRDLGLLVSNAGFGLKGDFAAAARGRIEAMLNVNARTPLLLAHALLPRLRARGRGGIILTGSVEGEAPYPFSTAYAATKAFVHSLGMGLHGELAGSGVDMLVLAPGATDTEAITLQGFKPELMPNLMSPVDVVKQALHQLGKTPLHVPGVENRKYVNMMRRMPRDKLIAFNAQAVLAALDAGAAPADARQASDQQD